MDTLAGELPRQLRLPPWIPDQVRDDDVLDKYTLTPRSAASRRVIFLQAPHLQSLLRDGAVAPPQDENGAEGQTWNTIIHQFLCALRVFFAPSAINLYASSRPRRRVGGVTGSIRACCPGSRIRSGMTAVENAEDAEKRRDRKGNHQLVTPAPPQDESGAEGQTWNTIFHQSLSALRVFSAPSAVNLYASSRPAQAGVQGHRLH